MKRLRRIRGHAREMKRLVAADIELYSIWPLGFRVIKPGHSRSWLFLYLFFTNHTFPAVFFYRLQTFFYDSGFQGLGTAVSRINHTIFGVTIGPGVHTTGGLFLAHGHIVVDGFIQLGAGVIINPFVTLGIRENSKDPLDLAGPVVGDDVHIGTGARILGRVHIGDGAKIGANAVVIDDVPAYHTAVGAPARSFPRAAPAKTPEDDLA